MYPYDGVGSPIPFLHRIIEEGGSKSVDITDNTI